jgi:tetratricopeptide (TPR) repeat protein
METKHGEERPFDRLAQLPSAASRLRFLSHHRLFSPRTVKRLNEAVSSLVRVDLNKARRFAAAAVTLADKLGDAESRAYALWAKANSVWFMGRNRAATQLHEQATHLFEEAGQGIEVGRTLSSSIQPLILLGEYDRALEAADRARKVFTAAGASMFAQKARMPLPLAQAEYNIAYLHYRRGHYAQAIGMLQKARKLSQNAGNTHRAALCQLDLSEIYLELNLPQEAAELATEAFHGFAHRRMRYEAAKALCCSAIAHSLQGQGLRAVTVFRRARALFVKEKNQVWPWLVDLYQAWAYFNEGQLRPARRHCLAALEFFRASPLRNRAILCRLLLARLSLRTGKIQQARRECRAALRDLSGKEMPILASKVT